MVGCGVREAEREPGFQVKFCGCRGFWAIVGHPLARRMLLVMRELKMKAVHRIHEPAP